MTRPDDQTPSPERPAPRAGRRSGGRLGSAVSAIEGIAYLAWFGAALVVGIRWVFGSRAVPLAPWAIEGLLVLLVGGVVVGVATWVAVRLKVAPPPADTPGNTPDDT